MLIKGDVFNVQFSPEVNIDFSLDNIFFKNVWIKNSFDIRTPEISDKGVRIMKVCILTENPEKVNTQCRKYKEIYQDHNNLISFKKKFQNFKNSTSVFNQENDLLIKNLNNKCTLGVTYKTFYLRICDKVADSNSDKDNKHGKDADLKEIEIIDFENVLSSYIPINIKVSDITQLQLTVNNNILAIKTVVQGLIKKVFLFKLS